MKVYMILLVVVVNFHRRSTREGMITWGKKYIESWLECVILKLEINDMNMSQKVFYRIKIIKSCGISIFRLIML